MLCAGELATDEDGRLVFVSSYSGHYRPLRAHLVAFLASLAAEGVRLDEVTVELIHPDGTASIYESAATLDHRP